MGIPVRDPRVEVTMQALLLLLPVPQAIGVLFPLRCHDVLEATVLLFSTNQASIRIRRGLLKGAVGPFFPTPDEEFQELAVLAASAV